MQDPTAAAAPAPAVGRLGSASPGFLTFREIWNRSFCRPLEQLVDVITEFPNEVEYIFRPSCVSLQRCGGCCGDEGLRCVPVETSTVTMQVSLPHAPGSRCPHTAALVLCCCRSSRCCCREKGKALLCHG
uniref:Platelet-derived growth factor (PDGF) family profile domain-containing protein n=1 Tax=Buteo japonicus TaxID=224669 RepID=A0A8C0BAW9_9AVES